ncbi:MAG TPA: RNA polymerase factor sigma-54 [Candidatus Marinimicrobia bacterium]|jgi:RNA polymerase sigma-54 factor|nr:RNA polymerase sigma-54 factor [Candidatus Neomarinimicrobiota bacterium]MDP6276115.1 RNA polymerase factor sigma-54 [Candidatus Neomarinimicrobiota bacterium]MDP7217412.1 RNA polymerase factor sigma-54 [Candidatus Neomarinimicrobiota bacterium]MDP7436585.1 RNA polymerase factor sigma-54 [Candidatus Neomarinimicrobiota bacterium]HJL74090.1 RNA polymerase factor sigma-54 [Candidatus Neomarinimicrobiota bacterium]|tara:strand:- start:8441 stop:9772 length:1332 start_codon:yes stop_codon:yes gene_type:complete
MTKLAQRLEQKQVLQPQQILQAAILQLNTDNLEERILEELEINPALDQVESNSEQEEEMTDNEDLDWELDDEYEPPNVYEKKEFKDMPIPQKKNFLEYLADQLNLINFDTNSRSMAEEIIYNLDENGYLAVDLELISDRFEMEMMDVLPILKKVQGFEPRGIAARDLQECLLLQIDKKEHPVAYALVNEYFDDVANHRYEHLAEKTGHSASELKHALEVISHLNPKPGEGHEDSETISVIPELIVYERDDNWVIVVNDSWLPDLQVSSEYVDMLAGELDKKAKSFIKKKVDSAEWFVDAISERRKTLTNVMQEIIKKQPEFFQGDVEKLKPMKLQDIADVLNMDVSTISRSTRGKYVDTPYGIFELKSFFTEGMITSSGEEISTMQIKRLLKELLDDEEKQHPYTDDKLKELLNEQGYPVARRTVAKYREQLHVPVARLRKQI